jgi:hypothetical protein
MRVVAPLTFVGSEASLMADIVRGVSRETWQGRFLSRWRREEEAPQLEVVPGWSERRAV